MSELALHNGTYTVSHPEHGHYVVKLHTVQNGGLAGKRIFSIQTGPNNESDFDGVAFWDDDARRAFVWKRFQGPNSYFPIDGHHWQRRGGWSKVEKQLTILLDLTLRGETGYWRQSGYTFDKAGRCLVCNKTLTTPESIASGIGPTCLSRLS